MLNNINWRLYGEHQGVQSTEYFSTLLSTLVTLVSWFEVLWPTNRSSNDKHLCHDPSRSSGS